MSPKTLLSIIALAALIAIGTTVFWQSSAHRRDIAQASLPQRPDLSRFHDLLERRIASAENRIENGEKPIEALAILSQLYHANGYYDEAIACYKGLIQAEPSQPQWPHRLASIYAKYGMLEIALPFLKRAVEQAPDYAPAWIRLGNCYLKQNRETAAVEAFQSALDADFDNPHAIFGLARIAAAQRNWENVRTLLESIDKNARIQIGIDLLVTAYEKTGHDQQALALRSRAKVSSAHNELPDPWISSLYEDCYDDYQLALAAGAAEWMGDTDTAIHHLKQAIELAPKSAFHPTQLGILYKNQKRSVEAQTEFSDAIQKNPKHADAWAYLVALVKESGNLAQAESVLDTGLAHNPKSYDLNMEKGHFLTQQSKLAQANTFFRIATKSRFDSSQPWIEAATNSFKLEQIPEGIQMLQNALGAEPDHPGALTSLAFAAIATGNRSLADETLERAARQPRVSQKGLRDLKSRYKAAFEE